MRAAFYESDITPPLGGFLWGHYKNVVATNIYQRLYAKAVVVEDNGTFAAIVCVDTVTIPNEMHKIVTDRIFEYTGIPSTNVCICSNHTHSGAPIVDAPEINCFADAAYKDVFYRIVADTVTLAYRQLTDVSVKFGTAVVNNISFNRDFILPDGKFVTFGRRGKEVKSLAAIDPELCVLTFEKDGKPIGAVINYALHQCCLNKYDGYSGDYSSILSVKLKEKYGEDFVSLFVLGACGDVNHADPCRTDKEPDDYYKTIGEILAKNTISAIDSSSPVTDGLQVIKTSVKIERRCPTTEEVYKMIEKLSLTKTGLTPSQIRSLIVYATTNTEKYSELYIMGIRIGNTMVHILPGEIYVNIGLELKKQSPFKNNMVIENANSYCGYIPTKEAFAENSFLYEASLCYHSCHVSNACDIIYEKAHEIAELLHK